MEWTPAKLRYLLIFHTLAEEKGSVRGIDIAVQLGISRASVSRMLTQFAEDGILQSSGRSGFVLTDFGRQESDSYYARYQSLYLLFHQQLKLPEYDARDCAVNLITSLSEGVAENLQQKCDAYLKQFVS